MILIITVSNGLLNVVKTMLTSRFEVKDLGKLQKSEKVHFKCSREIEYMMRYLKGVIDSNQILDKNAIK